MSDDTADELIRSIEQHLQEAASQGGAASPLHSPYAEGGIDGDPPEHRRAPLDEPVTYRLRIDLDDAVPPIWRRLDVGSQMRLDRMHEVLQAAFLWDDYHLHRFALGGGAFDRRAQHFLCPFDVEEGDPGVPEQDVRLDETLQEVGDRLRYTYDYGDSWDLTITVEKVLAADDGDADARCIGGRRAAPPEDSRGLSEEELIERVGDLASFDPKLVNERIRHGHPDAPPSFVMPLLRMTVSPDAQDDLVDRARHVQSLPPISLSRREKQQALHPFRWFLDAAAEGLTLTSAGYLKPAVVAEAADVVPSAAHWIGKKNREDQTAPVWFLRQSLQKIGLLRKYKGQLKLTKQGQAARGDTEVLWQHLAARCVVGKPDQFDHDLALLELIGIASAEEETVDFSFVTPALNGIGWRVDDGRPVTDQMLWQFQHTPRMILRELGPEDDELLRRRETFPRAAVALAREALALR